MQMQDMKLIHDNSAGIAFFWKKGNKILNNRVQLIFRETGFYLDAQELKTFQSCITACYQNNSCCATCDLKNHCNKFLLKTPCEQIDLAVSIAELQSIEDLVQGTIFKIELESFVFGEGMN